MTRFIVIVLVGAIAGGWWAIERSRAAQWKAQLADLHDRQRQLLRLVEERERLRRLQPTPEEWNRLRAEAAERERLQRKLEEKESASVAAVESAPGAALPGARAMRPGVWTVATEWTDCGSATAEAALETILWAAAGGELDSLKDALELGEEARREAEAVLDRLPVYSRLQYPTPEALVALFLAKDIPLEQVQLVACQKHQVDEVTAYVRLQDADKRTRQIFLSFRRRDDRWRLVVPTGAVEAMASDLAAVPPR